MFLTGLLRVYQVQLYWLQIVRAYPLSSCCEQLQFIAWLIQCVAVVQRLWWVRRLEGCREVALLVEIGEMTQNWWRWGISSARNSFEILFQSFPSFFFLFSFYIFFLFLFSFFLFFFLCLRVSVSRAKVFEESVPNLSHPERVFSFFLHFLILLFLLLSFCIFFYISVLLFSVIFILPDCHPIYPPTPPFCLLTSFFLQLVADLGFRFLLFLQFFFTDNFSPRL